MDRCHQLRQVSGLGPLILVNNEVSIADLRSTCSMVDLNRILLIERLHGRTSQPNLNRLRAQELDHHLL